MAKRARSGPATRPLAEYARKRDFGRTPEPSASRRASRPRARKAKALRFVVQRHDARHLHFDFRLEWKGTLKSWAVPKGPSTIVGEKRMAIEVEDHPLDYGDFEGAIPKGEYGAGTVGIWDHGSWEPIGDAAKGFAKGHLELRLAGEKLNGRWHLVRMKPRAKDRGKVAWLLIKASDANERAGTNARLPLLLATVGIRGKAPARPLPHRLAPQLATLVTSPPEGPEWLHELKLDGYRVLARIDRGKVRMLTRSGHDWTPRFSALAAELAKLPLKRGLIDGEVVALNAKGRSDFQALQRALDAGRVPLHYYAFDLPYANGRDLRDVPLERRRAALESLFAGLPSSSTLHFSRHVVGDGPGFFAEVCRTGAEGIVSKRADAPYRSARTRTWLKCKCAKRQEFVVVGYTDPRRSRVGVGALMLGVYDDAERLHYCGKVGTGFSAEFLRRLRERLLKLARAKPPVVDPERAERGAHWVKPTLVAEVTFTEWTQDGRIRHPSFVALRTDKPAKTIRRETPTAPPYAPRGANGVVEVAGVRLTHPDRVYFPELGVTKLELARYYESMADRILPGLAHRPLSLVRCPAGRTGACFYQKHVRPGFPERVGRVEIEKGEAPYAMVTDLASLIALVQFSVIEFHVWGSRADQLERPDQIVIDLDPDEAVAWPRLVETALRVRALLEGVDLVPFLRTTGGKGLHVVAPLVRKSSWEDVKAFTHAIATRFTREKPNRYTDRISKSRRRGKILIDYLRNQRDATTIASYSVRVRENAPIATPLSWSELEQAKKLPQWNVRNASERLRLPDPWADFERSRRAITKSAQATIAGRPRR